MKMLKLDPILPGTWNDLLGLGRASLVDLPCRLDRRDDGLVLVSVAGQPVAECPAKRWKDRPFTSQGTVRLHQYPLDGGAAWLLEEGEEN